MKLTRRNILKTSVLSGAAILAGTSQATPVNAPAKWDATYDVVIIGAGGGGMMAAHYAAEKGLKPVVLEKLAFPGGSSAVCGGQLSIADSPIQREKGIKDSEELFKKEMLKVGQNKNDPALVEAHIKSIREVFNFIHNTLGARPKSCLRNECAEGAFILPPPIKVADSNFYLCQRSAGCPLLV